MIEIQDYPDLENGQRLGKCHWELLLVFAKFHPTFEHSFQVKKTRLSSSYKL